MMALQITSSMPVARTSPLRLASRTALVPMPLSRSMAPAITVPRSGLRVSALFQKESDTKNADSRDITEKGSRVRTDKDAVKVSPLQPAFTRRREVFIGRLAMVGFLASVLGELATGKGALGQIGLYTGTPTPYVNLAIFAIVAYSYLGAINPRSPTWSPENQEDVRKRPAGPLDSPNEINIATDPKGFLGITNWGFTKRNELFVGRLAMLGFAAEVVGENLTHGRGALGQLGLPFNLPLNAGLAGWGLAVWVGVAVFFAFGFGNLGQVEGDEDIY